MNQREYSGVWTALVTPFHDGKVDFESLDSLVRRQMESNSISGFVVGGTTGESPTLDETELSAIFNCVKAASGGLAKIFVGTGTNSTRETIRRTQLAGSWGADGALVVVPYYNKPSQSGLVAHFTAVADASSIPIMLYNVPGRTLTALSLETIQTLAQHPRIEAIKEASGQIEFGAQIAATTKLALLSGDDGSCLKLARVGGVGVVSVISHLFPQRLREGFSDLETNQKRVESFLEELNTLLYVEANPIPLKWALFEMGWIRANELRLPLTPLNERFQSGLREALSRAGLFPRMEPMQ